MKGQAAQGDDALSADEQALLDADRSNTEPVPDEPIDDPAVADESLEDEPIDDPAVSDEPARKNATVPLHALHKERAAAKAADERAAAAEARHAAEQKRSQTLEERMNLLLQRIAPPQQPQQQAQEPEPAPLPPLDQDPVGHLKGDIGQLRQELRQRDQILTTIAQAVAGQNQQSERQRGVSELAIRASALEQEYAEANPEYHQAYKYMIEAERRELRAQGWTSDADMLTFIGKKAEQLAAHSIQRGVNPASVIHEMAKIRGWKPEPNGDGSVIPTPQPDPAAVQQIQTIARGQEQARGLSGVPGQAAAPVNANAIANMKEDEFSAFIEKLKKTSPSEYHRVMGA